MRRLRQVGFAFLISLLFSMSIGPSPAEAGPCGAVIAVAGHDGTEVRVSLAGPVASARGAVVLLPGGGGFVDLDGDGCPRKLKGNSLIRQAPLFQAAGLVTALVDAPSDYQDRDGLKSFRIDPAHAEDIGRVIAEVRRRLGTPVWLIGTSRGGISAANAASRLNGPVLPDGVVLTSPVTEGRDGAMKPWVADDVFDLPLENIRIPILVVVHGEDRCVRTPPDLAPRITDRTESAREQVVTVTGGPGGTDSDGVKACKGRSPHGFIDQEEEVAAGIVRFISGAAY